MVKQQTLEETFPPEHFLKYIAHKWNAVVMYRLSGPKWQ